MRRKYTTRGERTGKFREKEDRKKRGDRASSERGEEKNQRREGRVKTKKKTMKAKKKAGGISQQRINIFGTCHLQRLTKNFIYFFF